MKTEVIMKRELFGVEVRQKSKEEYFNATDVVKAGNKFRVGKDLNPFNLSQFLEYNSTKEFIKEIEESEKVDAYKISKGRNGGTWVHPLLLIDIALAIHPKLKLEAYKWLHDFLLKNRNKSGESFNKMTGVLYNRHGDKKTYHKFINSVCLKIREYCGVSATSKDAWQNASEEQLEKRDKIHNRVYTLACALNKNEEAIRLAFLEK